MTQKITLELDCRNLLEDAIGTAHGLAPAELDAMAEPVAGYTGAIQRRRSEDIGFMDLPLAEKTAEDVLEKSREIRSWCRNFVVLGIGGSALGNIAIRDALQGPFHNYLPAADETGEKRVRIFVLDNIDPSLLADFFRFIGPELRQTVFNVITKSGSTAETMSQFLHVRDVLRRTGGCTPEKQIILTTDPDPGKSLLRRIGEREGYAMFPIPANVGGRFSVLSAVGLLSAAAGGCDIRQMLSGAAAMDIRCSRAEMYDNPAALYACALFKHYERGKNITVLMPYSHRLRSLALWQCQLWAESLGKRAGHNGKDIFTGPTPVAATGVTDQHSVMQLFQDGPFDKVLTFIEINRCCEAGGLRICEDEAESELQYLARSSFNNLMAAELTATRCALRDKKRANCSIKLPDVSARTLGELFIFFQYAVTYSGYLYGVNAFDQPGVELGKRYTYGLMGRAGYEPPRL